jgi:hypothetical protein
MASLRGSRSVPFHLFPGSGRSYHILAAEQVPAKQRWVLTYVGAYMCVWTCVSRCMFQYGYAHQHTPRSLLLCQVSMTSLCFSMMANGRTQTLGGPDAQSTEQELSGSMKGPPSPCQAPIHP